MKKYKITHIHTNVNLFNGSMYFLLDNRILNISCCTPYFNDYSEYRIDGLILSKGDYDPSGNEVELKPYKGFTDIEITEEEYNFIKKYFEYSDDHFESLEVVSDDELSPYRYLGEPQLTSMFYENDPKTLVHVINKYSPSNEDYYEPEMDYITDKENPFIVKDSLLSYQGMYNLLIPFMELFTTNWNKGK